MNYLYKSHHFELQLHTQASVVKSEVLPFFYVAGVINGIDEVVILVIVNNAENRQLITHEQRIPEPQDTTCGFGRGNHVVTVRHWFAPLNLRSYISHTRAN